VSVGTGALEAPMRLALPPQHDMTIVIDHRDVVMVSGPIDSAIQAQGVITPLIGAVVPGGLTRRPNRRTPRSVISRAVRDSSPPQDFVLSKSSRLGGGLGQRHPTTTPRDLPPGAPLFRTTSSAGRHQASPGRRPRKEQSRSDDRESIPTKRLGGLHRRTTATACRHTSSTNHPGQSPIPRKEPTS
jgi:hypothetical protein